MDVNYSRWMSKDPDADPDVIEDEPRHFRLPRPSRSVVASGAMLVVIALAGAVVRSTATPEGSSTGEDPTVTATTADKDSGPGAASIEDTTDAWTSDSSTSDSSAAEDSTTSDDDVTSDEGWASPAEPPGPLPERRRMERREFGPPDGMPPGGPPPGRALRAQMGRP